MAFPDTPLRIRVDLNLNGLWVDATGDVLVRDGINITRGRADEASSVDPSACGLTFANRDGRYSPRNPASPYFGILNRNTPVRVGVGTPPAVAAAGGLSGTSIAAPSVTAESAGYQLAAWGATPGGDWTVPAGWTAGLESDGALSSWRGAAKILGAAGPTGAAAATYSVPATSAVGIQIVMHGPTASGSGFSGLATQGGSVILARPVTAGQYLVAVQGWSADPDDEMVAPPEDQEAPGCGWMLLADTGPSAGPRLRAWLRPVLVTETVNLLYRGQARGSATAGLPDNLARLWVMSAVTDYSARFTGEVPSWAPRSDRSGEDVWVPVQPAGILRRLGQGAAPLHSALHREFSRAKSVRAYWPLEDGDGATSFASALGGPSMMFLGTPQLAASDVFDASEALPTFTGAGARGTVPTHTTTNAFTVGALMAFPTSGMADESTLLTISATGTVRTWTLKYDNDIAGLRVEAFDADGNSLLNNPAGPWTPSLLGGRFFVYLTAQPSGANVSYLLGYAPIGSGQFVSGQFISGTITGRTVGRVTTVAVGTQRNLAGDPTIGHVVATSAYNSLWTGEVYRALVAWWDETAAERIRRLCIEESVPIWVPYLPTSAAMGPQRPKTLLELLAECETTDGGVLHEPRGFVGLAYRTRTSKYSQAAALALDYAAGHIGDPFEPTDDDQGVVNDVTVTRPDGSSARSVLEDGALSVQPPPDGIGRYDTGVEVNVNRDDALPDQASWRLHTGTWDEARYPAVTVQLAPNTALVSQLPVVDVGDRVTIANLPAWLPPGGADLLAEGFAEALGLYAWDFTFNCSPAGPYRVGVWDSATYGRADSDYSTLAEDLDTTETGVDVAVAAGRALWITTATHPTQFPFAVTVGGEEMTVTGIVGATSPQTFTVVRSANGIVKTHLAGAEIHLARPAVYAL